MDIVSSLLLHVASVYLSRMKILVVEDEQKLNAAIVQGLRSRGYTVDAAFDGAEGERIAREHSYDCIVLDVMMPIMDGFLMCKKLRAVGVQTPVLFLTAKSDVHEKVSGFNVGADDYMVKPFSFDELVARIRAITRRAPTVQGDVLTLNALSLDTRSQIVTINGKVIDLTLREYALLEYFLRNQDAVVTREDILSHVWDRFFDSLSNVVDVHLKNLRKKLPKEYAKRIQTVWGKGYRLIS